MNNKTIRMDGMEFTQSSRVYYYNSANRIYLHRYIWEKEHGSIPRGFEIHHIDGDAENNDLSNLTLLTADEHKAHHANLITDERREFLKRNMEEKARPAAIEWHKSESGREWHKEHYEEMKHLLHKKGTFVCESCGCSYETTDTKANRFCSNACKSKWRRDNGVDDVTRQCPVCKESFQANKYSKKVCCSKPCAAKKRSADKQLSKDSPNLQE